MKTLNYPTGRNYGKPQVLEITVLSDHIGECGLRDVIATFVDTARNIKGRVETVVCGTIGESVLRAYDAGRYTTI